MNFQIKYFVEVNQPPQVSSDFNNAAHLRYFHTTLLDNLSLCPTHDYGNLSQSLAIRRVEWDPQKTLYLPSKISKIHPATESKNVEVASKLWGRHRFRRMGKEDENPIKQVANDNKSHVQQATDEAQVSIILLILYWSHNALYRVSILLNRTIRNETFNWLLNRTDLCTQPSPRLLLPGCC